MGGDDDQAWRDEYPKHEVVIDSFWMDVHEVTNAQFAAFVEATGYVTTAEKAVDWDEIKKELPPGTPKPDASQLAPASLVFVPTDKPVSLRDEVSGGNGDKAPIGGSLKALAAISSEKKTIL